MPGLVLSTTAAQSPLRWIRSPELLRQRMPAATASPNCYLARIHLRRILQRACKVYCPNRAEPCLYKIYRYTSHEHTVLQDIYL